MTPVPALSAVRPRIRRFNLAIALAGLAMLGGLAGWSWAAAQAPSFAATATLMLSIPNAAPASEYEALRGQPAIAPAFATIAAEPEAVRAVSTSIGAGSVAEELVTGTSARVELGSRFISITTRYRDPAVAAAMANGLGRRLVTSTTLRGSGAGPHGAVTLVEPAITPAAPEAPQTLLDIVLGSLAGLVAAAGLIVAMRARRHVRLRDTTVRADDRRELAVGAALGASVIAALAVALPGSLVIGLMGLTVVASAVFPAAGLAALCMVLPQQDPDVLRAFGLKLPIIAAIAFGYAVRMIAARERPNVRVGWVAAAGYLGLALATSLPFLSGLQGDAGVAAAARFLQLVGGGTIVAIVAHHYAQRDPRALARLAAASSAFTAFLGIVQFVGETAVWAPLGGLFPAQEGALARITGPFQNPNYYALFVGLGLVMTLGIAMMDSRHRRFLVAMLVPLVVAMAATFSRGGAAAVAVGLLVLLGFRNRRAAVVAAMLLLVVGAAAYPYLVDARLERSSTGGLANAQSGLEESDAERWEAVAAGGSLFALDPVFGVGFGQYEYVSPRFLGSSPATSAHNQYVKILAEQGLVGLLMASAVLAGAAVGLRESRSPLRATAIAMLATYGISGLFLEPLTTLQTSGMLWIVVGATLAAAGPRVAIPVRETLWRRVAYRPAAASQAVT